MNANPVIWVARLPRIRCLRSWDRCLITQRLETIVDISFYISFNHWGEIYNTCTNLRLYSLEHSTCMYSAFLTTVFYPVHSGLSNPLSTLPMLNFCFKNLTPERSISQKFEVEGCILLPNFSTPNSSQKFYWLQNAQLHAFKKLTPGSFLANFVFSVFYFPLKGNVYSF